jgi:hypothetical protein
LELLPAPSNIPEQVCLPTAEALNFFEGSAAFFATWIQAIRKVRDLLSSVLGEVDHVPKISRRYDAQIGTASDSRGVLRRPQPLPPHGDGRQHLTTHGSVKRDRTSSAPLGGSHLGNALRQCYSATAKSWQQTKRRRSMPKFKAASRRNMEDQSDPVAVLSLISGLGLVISSIFEYKAHKDNPTQVPLQVAVLSLIAGLGFFIFGMSRGQTPRG